MPDIFSKFELSYAKTFVQRAMFSEVSLKEKCCAKRDEKPSRRMENVLRACVSLTEFKKTRLVLVECIAPTFWLRLRCTRELCFFFFHKITHALRCCTEGWIMVGHKKGLPVPQLILINWLPFASCPFFRTSGETQFVRLIVSSGYQCGLLRRIKIYFQLFVHVLLSTP